MSSPSTEINHLEGDTYYQCVRAHDADTRTWLKDSPICTLLQKYQIEHLGVMFARSPYKIVRPHQSGAFFLVTIRGKGRALVNGEWHVCTPGEALILPAYNTNALVCYEDEEWDFCWVRYRHEDGQTPLIHATSALVADFPFQSFHSAIEGLMLESQSPNREAITQQWVQLVHIYISEFLKSHQLDDRLWKLWFHIEKQLDLEWNLDSMSKVANLSAEHLRRLCKSQYGRSPVQQLRWLRMQRAAELLLSTDYKIEAIAYDLGYKNPIVFSSAFKKHYGVQPSLYRIQGSLS